MSKKGKGTKLDLRDFTRGDYQDSALPTQSGLEPSRDRGGGADSANWGRDRDERRGGRDRDDDRWGGGRDRYDDRRGDRDRDGGSGPPAPSRADCQDWRQNDGPSDDRRGGGGFRDRERDRMRPGGLDRDRDGGRFSRDRDDRGGFGRFGRRDRDSYSRDGMRDREDRFGRRNMGRDSYDRRDFDRRDRDRDEPRRPMRSFERDRDRDSNERDGPDRDRPLPKRSDMAGGAGGASGKYVPPGRREDRPPVRRRESNYSEESSRSRSPSVDRRSDAVGNKENNDPRSPTQEGSEGEEKSKPKAREAAERKKDRKREDEENKRAAQKKKEEAMNELRRVENQKSVDEFEGVLRDFIRGLCKKGGAGNGKAFLEQARDILGDEVKGLTPSLITARKLLEICDGIEEEDVVRGCVKGCEPFVSFLLNSSGIRQHKLHFIKECQRVTADLGLPRISPASALIETVFDQLYVDDVIEEQYFQMWREAVDESDNDDSKPAVLFQVHAFLEWLNSASAEGHSRQVEDGDSSDDSQSDIEKNVPKRQTRALLPARP